MKFEVVKQHTSENETPITVKKGEKIKLGKRSGELWPNWIYCYRLDGCEEGWTPEQMIKIEHGYGYVLEDYDAKELTVYEHNVVEGTTEINGWIWCVNLKTLEEGWLPKENLISVKNDF